MVLDENEIQARTNGAAATLLLQNSGGELGISGNVGVGTTNPSNRLHVRGAISGTATLANHLAAIENTTGSASPDVLALGIGVASTTGTNFITFFDNSGAVGAIEGTGSSGIQLISGSADFAEYLLKQNVHAALEPGDVVGLRAGRVSKNTVGAERVLVVSTSPIVLGARPLPSWGRCRSGCAGRCKPENTSWRLAGRTARLSHGAPWGRRTWHLWLAGRSKTVPKPAWRK
jgi:hypothetical protein